MFNSIFSFVASIPAAKPVIIDLGRSPVYKRNLFQFSRCASESILCVVQDRKMRASRFERKNKTIGKLSVFL